VAGRAQHPRVEHDQFARAGKTTLLERTIRELTGRQPVTVIEGDQETLLDADRIQAAGGRAVQVNATTPDGRVEGSERAAPPTSGVEMTARTGVHLDSPPARRLNPIGVQQSFLVAFDHGDG